MNFKMISYNVIMKKLEVKNSLMSIKINVKGLFLPSMSCNNGISR